MAQTRPPSPAGKITLGLLLIAAGAGALGVMFAALYRATPELESFSLRLGLAFGAFFSGLAQVALVVGVWIVWSALRRGRS
ncbi:MAG: hypothetical protein ACOY5Y_20725 [Pseudomonadota bacterium]